MTGTKAPNRNGRLSKIEELLFHSSIGLRAVEIAKACGVDRRTIYRDLSTLNDVGIPIQQKDGRFFINRNKYGAATRLTFDEAMALFMAARVASRLEVCHNLHIDSALQKVSQALPRVLQSHIQAITESDLMPTIDLDYLRVLDTMSRGWGERLKVRLWTAGRRDGKPKMRDFMTYLIEPNENGDLCAIGYDSLTQQIAVFKLTRISRARLTPTTYQIPEQFDASRYLTGSWSNLAGDDDSLTDVVLLFTPEAAPLLHDRPWPGNHRLEYLDDNSLVLTLYVPDWHDLLPWIRSWGSDVEVLEPPLLRQEYAQEVARMEARYRANAGGRVY